MTDSSGRELVERHVAEVLFCVFEGREPPTEYPLQGQWIVAAKAAIEATESTLLTRVEALTAERDALLQKPLDLAKMDSIDDVEGIPDKMLAYYWCEQAREARAAIASIRKDDELREALECGMIDWQKIPDEIDTAKAPFDGEEVLLYADSATVDVVRLGWWRTGEDFNEDPEDRGWWSYEHSVTQEHLGYLPISHWAPFNKPQVQA